MFRYLFCLLVLLSGCSTVTPGTVVLEVSVCGDTAGQHTVLHGGRYWPMFAMCTDYYTLQTREQRANWAKNPTGEEAGAGDRSITFAGKDGQKVNVDVSVGYMLGESDEQIVHMVKTFGYDVDQVVANRVRDSLRNDLNLCASTMSVEDIYGLRKGELFACAEQKVRAEYEPTGLRITRVTLNSEVRLPEEVQKAMAASTAATQHAERTRREVESTRAEGEKVVAQAEAQAKARIAEATAEAEANRILSESITPQLIRLRELEIEKAKAEKWNGALPVVSGSGGSMILDVGEIAAGSLP
jgi:regulator of protease activity HflC (stomatin/prohibitin superfamily)